MGACIWNSRPCSIVCSIFSLIAAVNITIFGIFFTAQPQFIPDVVYKNPEKYPKGDYSRKLATQCWLSAALYLALFLVSLYYWKVVHVLRVNPGGKRSPRGVTELTQTLIRSGDPSDSDKEEYRNAFAYPEWKTE